MLHTKYCLTIIIFYFSSFEFLKSLVKSYPFLMSLIKFSHIKIQKLVFMLFISPGLCIFLFLVFQFGIISQKFREHYSTVYVTSPVLCAPWLFPLCHRLTAISMVWVERVLYKLATIFEIPLIEFHFLDNVTWFQETPIIFAIERVRHQFLITHCYLCLN